MDVSGGKFEDISTIEHSAQNLDPFWATRLWQQLVKEVLLKVRVSRQRQFLKPYDQVFNGTELVDVVFEFLKKCPSNLISDRIERINAIKVCQALMESKLFESAIPKCNSKFEDSTHKLYRFVAEKGNELNKKCEENKENNKLSHSIKDRIDSPLFQSMDFEDIDSSLEAVEYLNLDSLSPCPKRRNFHATRSLRTPLSKIKNMKHNSVFSHRKYQQKCRLVSQNSLLSIRDSALSHLLHFVEIPILESILSIPYALPELPDQPELIIENGLTLTKCNWPRPISKNFMDIPWVQAAAECLARMPPGVTKLWSIQSCKIHCYQSVVERFNSSLGSIIPTEYVSVCTSIVDMLKHENREKAINVLQLFMIVIPWQRRLQLQNLLKFLLLVIEDIFVNIDKKVTNYEAVSRDFLSVVFDHPLVEKKHCQILFDFMIFKVNRIFEVPRNLQRRNPDISFCKKLSINDIETVRIQCTHKSLQELAFSVMDSTSIKLGEKKAWAKKLKKHHLQVYESCFS